MYRHFIVFLLSGVILMGCSITKPPNDLSSLITWSDLQVTPSVNGTLCWDVSLLGDKPTWEQVKRDFGTGLVMKLDIPGAKEIGYQTYEIPSGLPLEAELYVWYGEENSKYADVRFLILLDEQQLDAFTSNRDYHDAMISPGSEMAIPIKIPPVSLGVHDLVIIGIPYLNEYPNPEGIVKILPYRITLVVSPITTFPFRQIDFVNMPAKGLLSRGEPKIPLMLSLSDHELKVWDWPHEWLSTETSTLEFFVLSGYENVTNLDAPYLSEPESSFFTLVFFVDYQQVDIESGNRAIYGKVSDDTAYTTIQAKVNLQQGKHHILVVKINSPGIPMCILYGPPSGRILPFDVIATLHGVDVRLNNK